MQIGEKFANLQIWTPFQATFHNVLFSNSQRIINLKHHELSSLLSQKKKTKERKKERKKENATITFYDKAEFTQENAEKRSDPR